MYFISGLSSHKLLFMNDKQIQWKQAQEELCSRLESAETYLCVKYEQTRIIFFTYPLGGINDRKINTTET